MTQKLTKKQLRERKKTIRRKGYSIEPHDRLTDVFFGGGKKVMVRGLRYWLSDLRKAAIKYPSWDSFQTKLVKAIDGPLNINRLQSIAHNPAHKSELTKLRNDYKLRIQRAANMPWPGTSGDEKPSVLMLSTMVRVLNASNTDLFQAYTVTNTPWDEKPKREDLVWKLNKIAKNMIGRYGDGLWPHMHPNLRSDKLMSTVKEIRQLCESQYRNLPSTPYLTERLEAKANEKGMVDVRFARRAADEVGLKLHWMPVGDFRANEIVLSGGAAAFRPSHVLQSVYSSNPHIQEVVKTGNHSCRIIFDTQRASNAAFRSAKKGAFKKLQVARYTQPSYRLSYRELL